MTQIKNQTQKHIPEKPSRNTKKKPHSEFLLGVFPDFKKKKNCYLSGYLLWTICIPAKIPVLNPKPQCDVNGRWGLWEVTRS